MVSDMKIIFVVVLHLSVGQLPEGQEIENPPISNEFFFYSPDSDEGAHPFHTPVSIALQAGFEEYSHKRLHDLDSQLVTGMRNLLYGFTNPLATLKHYGYKNFFFLQFVPFGDKIVEGVPSWLANYKWHLIGGGFRNRLLTEYYTAKGSEYPKTYAWLAMYVGHWLNESIQAIEATKGSADGFADLIFFDSLGKFLFANDSVARFFAHTLHLSDWSYQMSWSPITNTLIDTGQMYWMRLPVYGPFSISLLTGHLVNTLNITLSNEGGHQWTFGLGGLPDNFFLHENKDLRPGALHWSAVLGYSRNDNPLALFLYLERATTNPFFANVEVKDSPNATSRDRRFSLYAYPKWFKVFGVKLGLHMQYRSGVFYMGFTNSNPLLGLSGAIKTEL